MGEIRPLRPKTGVRGRKGPEISAKGGKIDHRSWQKRLAWVNVPGKSIDQGFPKMELTINNNFLKGGYNTMSDIYSVGNAGSVGPNSGANATNTIISNCSSVDTQTLLKELEKIELYIKNNSCNKENADITNDISKASDAIKDNRKEDAIKFIRACGTKLYDIAKSIGCTVVARLITHKMGL